MENNIIPSESSNSRFVPDIFDDLEADRARLVEHFRAPKWLAPGYGLIAAAYVSIPAFPDEPTGDFVLIAAVIVGFLLVGNAYRATGIKISRFGAREWAAFAAAVLGSLVLHSVSLGLASLGLRWWIAASASAAFVLVLWLTRLIFSSLRERLRNDR